MNLMMAYVYIKAFAELLGVKEATAIKYIEKELKNNDTIRAAIDETKIAMVEGNGRNINGASA